MAAALLHAAIIFRALVDQLSRSQVLDHEFGVCQRSVSLLFVKYHRRGFPARDYRDGLFIWPVFDSVTATGNAPTTGIDVEGRLLSQSDVPYEIQDAGLTPGRDVKQQAPMKAPK